MCSFHCYEDLPTCGEGGIRTHGGASPTTVFETVPFNRSGTSPIVAWLFTGSPQIIAQLPLNIYSITEGRIFHVSHPVLRQPGHQRPRRDCFPVHQVNILHCLASR